MYDQQTTLGWGTLSLINAAIVQTKNRNAAGWLLISLLIGPLATALLVLLPKVELTHEIIEENKRREKLTTMILTVVVILLALALVGSIIMFLTRV